MANGEISGPPAVDFYGMLSGLGNTIHKGMLERAAQQKEQAGLAAFSQLDPNSPNYMAAAQAAFQSGNMEAGQKLLALKIADDERKHTYAREGVTDSHWNQDYALRKAAAARANDPTPDNFVADKSVPGGYRPIGPADPAYIESVAAAKARAASLVPPDGFVKQPDGSVAPLPGGPQDPAYQARVAAETARARGDVPTIMGPASSVIIPNKASEGPIYTNKPPPGASLDDDTLTSMAGQYLSGDKSVFTNIGRGAQGAENIIRLRQRVKDLSEAQGMSPADVAHRIAEFSGDMASQRTLGVRQTNADMAVTEAQKMSDLALAASANFLRTSYPKVNQAIQAYKENTGDPNIMRFGAANLAFVNTYARAISPQGTPTVHDKIAAVAEGKLSTAASHEQYQAIVDQMRQEMAAAKAAPAQVKQDLRDAASGRPKINGGKPIPVQSPSQAMKLPPGTPIILPDGSPGVVPGG